MTDWQLAFDHLEAKINEDLLKSCLKNVDSCSGRDENELKLWVRKLDHSLYYSKVDETTFVSHIAFLAKGYLKVVIDAFVEKRKSEGKGLMWIELRQEIVANFWPIDNEETLIYH